MNKVELKIIVYAEKQVTESDVYFFATPVKFWKTTSSMWVLLVLEEFGRSSVSMKQKKSTKRNKIMTQDALEASS